jgi:hypothetical protein
VRKNANKSTCGGKIQGKHALAEQKGVWAVCRTSLPLHPRIHMCRGQCIE